MDMPDEIWCDHGQIFYNTKGGTRYIKADLAQSLADALEGGPTSGSDFLEWIADRLVNVYGESDNVDFVLSLRLRAQQHRAALANYRKGE